MLVRPIDRLSGIPFVEVTPTGLLLLLPDGLLRWVFEETGLSWLYFGSGILALVAATGWRFRLVSPAACALLILYASVRRSYTFVSHADIPLTLAACAMALLSWADHRDERRPASERVGANYAMGPLFISMAVLLLTYHLVGVRRFVLGGWDLYASDSLPYWVARNALRGEGTWEAAATGGVGLELARSGWALTALQLGFPVVTLVELLAPLALFYQRFRWIFLAVMVPFHLFSLPVFSLIFYQNIVLLAFLPDWDGIRAARAARQGPRGDPEPQGFR